MESKILAFAEPSVIEVVNPGEQNVVDSGNPQVRQPPKRFCLLKFGKVNYTKGGKDDEFVFAPENAQEIVDEFKRRGKDLVIDWDHSTLRDDSSHAGNAPAAGWAENLEVSPDGLYAVVKNWTPKGVERLGNGEYRYMSPVLQFKDGKAPSALHSIALTNHPAIHNIPALVAANDLSSKYKDTIRQIMDGKDKMDDMLVKTVEQYSDHVKGNEQEESELKAFMDEILTVKSFAEDAETQDTLNIISNFKLNNKVPPINEVTAMSKDAIQSYLAWLDSNVKINADKDVIKRLYQAEYDSYAAKLGNIPANVASPLPAAPYQPPPASTPIVSAAPMNDSVPNIPMVDSKVDEFLKLHDCKTLDDVSKKIMELDSQKAKEIKALNDKIAEINAEGAVKKAMEDGKVTQGMREVALNMARKDIKDFEAWVSISPKIVESFTDETQSEAKAQSKESEISDTQKQVFKLMGV